MILMTNSLHDGLPWCRPITDLNLICTSSLLDKAHAQIFFTLFMVKTRICCFLIWWTRPPSHCRHPQLSAPSQFADSPNPPSAENLCYPMSHTLKSVQPQAWCTLLRYPPTTPHPQRCTLPPAVRSLSRGDWNVCWGISLKAADGLEAPGVPQCSVLTSPGC